MAKKEYSAGAVVYIFDDKIKFLLLKNTLKKSYWGFPKGKIEEDESLKDTAKREIEEETKLNNLEFLPGFQQDLQWYFRLKGQTIKKKATYFIVKVPKEDIDKVRIGEEHEDFKWLDYNEALEVMNIKNNKKLLKKAYKVIKKYEGQRKLF